MEAEVNESVLGVHTHSIIREEEPAGSLGPVKVDLKTNLAPVALGESHAVVVQEDGQNGAALDEHGLLKVGQDLRDRPALDPLNRL